MNHLTQREPIPDAVENMRERDRRVSVEWKAVEKIIPMHHAQVLTYLKPSGLRLDLLINFNVPLMKDDYFKRIVL